MREIKFRGQKIETKEWVYGSLILGLNGVAFIVIINNKISIIRILSLLKNEQIICVNSLEIEFDNSKLKGIV